MSELIYPISLDYVPHWGDWHVIRELVQNAWDADPNFRMSLEDDTVVITDSGAGAELAHLILGISDKGEADRGKWGEGLKLALLVLTRMGLKATIRGGGLVMWNESAELMGKEVFKVAWEEVPTDDGTEVTIPGWQHPLYESRFLRPGDPRIVHEDNWGRQIVKEDLPSLYYKGIYLSVAKSYSQEYAFGYNLVTTEIDRDRGVVESWKANTEIGKIWESVSDHELLVQFYKAVEDNCGEKDIWMQKTGAPKAHRRAFQEVFGTKAVVRTDDHSAREAEHIGNKVVRIPSNIQEVVKEAVGTDREVVQELQGQSMVSIADKDLTTDSLRILRGLRRVAKRVNKELRVDVYVLPDGQAANTSKQVIRIDVSRMDDEVRALSALLHELGHTETGARDTTDEMANAVTDLAAELLAKYVWRG